MSEAPEPPATPPASRTAFTSNPHLARPYIDPALPPQGHPAPLPYGYGYPPQQVVVTQVAAPGNPLGVAGFVIGLLALIFAFIPLIGMIAWLLSPIGLLLSGVGLARSPRGLAIAGMVLSGVALLICFGWLILLAI